MRHYPSFLTLARAFAALLLLGGAAAAPCQEWPGKPLRIVVPFSAGGSTDAVARLLAKKIETLTKQPAMVENITGGASIIGVQTVVNGPADGSTLVLTGSGSMSVLKHTNARLPLDPEAALTPVTLVNTLPHWIVVKADRQEKSFPDFVEFIRKNPGKVSISVNAAGGTAHLALANWAKQQQLDISVVPYRGSSAAMIDLLGGTTTAHVDVVGSSMSFVKAGKARTLGVLQAKPIADMPEFPAIGADPHGLVVSSTHVLAVKTGTPAPTIEQIYKVVKDVTQEPDFLEFLRNLGYERATPTPAESRELIRAESRTFKDFVRSTGITTN